MDAYYNQYFQKGKRGTPNGSQDEQVDETNTHYQASNQNRRQNGYNGENPSGAAAYNNEQQPPPNANGGANGGGMQQQQQPGANAKIYVSNMPQDCDERKLTELFGRYGEIIQITHKGSYAFIEFTEPGMADDAIAEMRSQGTQMRVQLAFSKNSNTGGGGQCGYTGSNDNQYGAPDAAKKFGGGGGAQGATNNCFKCGQDGHWASSCPQNGGMGRGQPGMGPANQDRSGMKCFNCQKGGHWARECPDPQQNRGGGGYRGNGGGRGGGGGYGGGYGGGRGGGGYGF